jgi:hypothetical protein
MTGPLTNSQRPRIKTSLPCPACGKSVSFWRIFLWRMLVWPPSQKKCPACEAKLRLETRNEMSFKGSLIYLLLVVAIFSCMALRWISLSREKSLDWIFWILVPVILFIIAPIVALYQINADVIYLKESEKPNNPSLFS